MESIVRILAREFSQGETQVKNVVELIAAGNTIPFIARYRKELHGSMDDTTLRNLADRLAYLQSLAARREEVKKAVAAQDKLTGELSAKIDAAATLAELEDLYRPYKQKRRTRASLAREKGLEPLALALLEQKPGMLPPEKLAGAYIDPEKGVESVADALAGASAIVAETVSDDAAVRKKLRELIARDGVMRVAAAK